MIARGRFRGGSFRPLVGYGPALFVAALAALVTYLAPGAICHIAATTGPARASGTTTIDATATVGPLAVATGHREYAHDATAREAARYPGAAKSSLRNHVPAAGFLAAEGTAEGGGNIVYRGLAEGEDPAAGLSARNPAAGNDVVSHVAGARNSQWISTTKSLDIAQARFGENGVVQIDLSMVDSEIADLSNGIPGLSPNAMLSRWARNAQEVLVQGYIPPEAITPVP